MKKKDPTEEEYFEASLVIEHDGTFQEAGIPEERKKGGLPAPIAGEVTSRAFMPKSWELLVFNLGCFEVGWVLYQMCVAQGNPKRFRVWPWMYKDRGIGKGKRAHQEGKLIDAGLLRLEKISNRTIHAEFLWPERAPSFKDYLIVHGDIEQTEGYLICSPTKIEVWDLYSGSTFEFRPDKVKFKY